MPVFIPLLNVLCHYLAQKKAILMKVLLQRVASAKVEVDKETVGTINKGLLMFLGVEKEDSLDTVNRLVDRLVHYRVFADEAGKMNLNIQQVSGELLVVSQFTLAADTRKGRRPGFQTAASPEEGERLYQAFIDAAKAYVPVATGSFGADMQVSLVNDGPVTFLLSD